ncbi:MAG TPA: hypothetical protein DCM54_12430 [Gammaproteobacteria bacterium]|nr:hypothetical protein [Gammaproteobacteria bacterium]
MLDNKLSGEQNVMTTYLTNNVSWHADFIATLSGDESEIDLRTWVTIHNASGKTYTDSKVSLVSGQVNRVSNVVVTGVQPFQADRRMSLAKAESSMGLPTRQDFFEYHEYDVNGRTTLRDNEQKQLKLMEALHIDVEKSYVLRSEALRHQMSDPVEHKFDVVLKFENDTQQPLPAGRIRVFKANSQGSPQLAGEDRIGHVPVDDEVEITLGKAFDLTAEKRQTEFRRVGDRALEIGHRVVVQNHKDEPVVVHLHEKIHGDWRVVKESHKGEKTDSSTLAYTLSLGKSERQTVTYSVRLRW